MKNTIKQSEVTEALGIPRSFYAEIKREGMWEPTYAARVSGFKSDMVSRDDVLRLALIFKLVEVYGIKKSLMPEIIKQVDPFVPTIKISLPGIYITLDFSREIEAVYRFWPK